MLKDVLVCLDSTIQNEVCQRAAIDFVARRGGTLTGLFVQEPPYDALPGFGYMNPMVTTSGLELEPSSGEEVEMEIRIAELERVRKGVVMDPFLERARAQNVSAYFTYRLGSAAAELKDYLRYEPFDLVVMGRGKADAGPVLGSVTTAVLREVHQPVLIANTPGVEARRIGVAYDGSYGSHRALRLATEIALQAGLAVPHIDLLIAGVKDGSLCNILEPAQRYLHVYGVTSTVHAAPEEAGEVIPYLAHQRGLDLLCMGAFGKWRIREVLLGSTTLRVMSRWSRSLLLCH
jgi:nucleotide-binding universal stress UspA family protein